MVWSRRSFAAGSVSLVAAPSWAAAAKSDADALLGPQALRAWWALDLASGRTLGENPDLQLPMCSSFKWLLAAMILWQSDHGLVALDREIAFGSTDILPHSPTVEAAFKAAGTPRALLSIARLCEAAVALSDNGAANVLLRMVGGPPALTAWLRDMGDHVTRLDHYELELNRVPPGSVLDTTTPRASVGNLSHLLYGEGLKDGSKVRLLGWLQNAKPGAARLPAGLGPGWRIGHKTGTWTVEAGHGPTERAASADVAVLLPTTGKPVLIAAFTAGSERPQTQVDQWFAGLAATASSPDWLRRG